jgi:catechol 2,3-dioxygenase-like lactoylglutathione lyase family enzyme
MKINGYHHIGLYVKDSEKSRAFYESLGGKVRHSFLSKTTGKNVYLIDLGGGAVIEVIPKGIGKAETDPHWVHAAFKTEDPGAEYDAALKAGATSMQEPKEITLGAMAATNAFVLGPDGEVIEFFKEMSR